MGPGGLEPPTSPLSGVRSNQLSYEPGRGVSCGATVGRDALPGGDPVAPEGAGALWSEPHTISGASEGRKELVGVRLPGAVDWARARLTRWLAA